MSIEDRVQVVLGQQALTIISLQNQLEEANKRIKDLEEKQSKK